MSTFTEPEERIELRKAVAKLASKYGQSYFLEKARAGEKTTELWLELGRNGYLGVNLPEEYGGGGGGLGDVAAVLEEVGAAGCPLLLMVVSPAICGTVITRYGTDEQKRRWLPGIADGTETMAFAITEPDAGTNSHNIVTAARRDGDEWVLNGRKVFISGLDESTNVLVVARTEDAKTGRLKPCLFVVPTDAPGFTFTPIPMEFVSPELQFQVFIDDVRLPADALVGFRAPDEWDAVGIATTGRVHDLDGRRPADRGRFTTLAFRDGGQATVIERLDGRIDVLEGAPVGWVVDVLRRVLGTAADPPEGSTALIVDVWWLDSMVAGLLERPDRIGQVIEHIVAAHGVDDQHGVAVARGRQHHGHAQCARRHAQLDQRMALVEGIILAVANRRPDGPDVAMRVVARRHAGVDRDVDAGELAHQGGVGSNLAAAARLAFAGVLQAEELVGERGQIAHRAAAGQTIGMRRIGEGAAGQRADSGCGQSSLQDEVHRWSPSFRWGKHGRGRLHRP